MLRMPAHTKGGLEISKLRPKDKAERKNRLEILGSEAQHYVANGSPPGPWTLGCRDVLLLPTIR